MKRTSITPRQNWEQKVIDQGFLFYKHESYYNETIAYEFNNEEIDLIETATSDLFEMCLEVVEYVIKNKLWDEFFIPKQYAELIEWSWQNDQPSFYGRFDLAFNNGQVKLLEFNADTPTSLLESSVIQWYWLQDYNKSYDQFNSIHEKLLVIRPEDSRMPIPAALPPINQLPITGLLLSKSGKEKYCWYKKPSSP